MTALSDNTENNRVAVQLQRSRDMVVQLLRNLESYRFVPKTYSLFEKKEDLKNGLDRFAKKTEELLATLKTQRFTIINFIEDVERQFAEFNSLRQEMDDYFKVVQH